MCLTPKVHHQCLKIISYLYTPCTQQFSRNCALSTVDKKGLPFKDYLNAFKTVKQAVKGLKIKLEDT